MKIKKKIFKEEQSFEILKILGLFENIPNILKHTLIEYIYIYIYIYIYNIYIYIYIYMHCFGGSEQLIKLLNEFFEKKY